MPRNSEANTTTDAVVTETLKEEVGFVEKERNIPHSGNCEGRKKDLLLDSRVLTARKGDLWFS